MSTKFRVLISKVSAPILLWLSIVPGVHAQKVLTTISVGSAPDAVAINMATNKIYITNFLGGNVTVIDGATNTTTTIQTGVHPRAVAVDEITNKIYVACHGSFPGTGGDPSGITVIDGATGSTTTVAEPELPNALAVNTTTNKIYVAHEVGGSVTVIDGDTNDIVTIAVPSAAGLTASAIAVNPLTDKIYVANNDISDIQRKPGNITVIDGATNVATVVTDPSASSPYAIAANAKTNKIYVANEGDLSGANHGNVTVIDGATNTTSTLTDPQGFVPYAVAVDQTTNKIFVANFNDAAGTFKGSITLIDGVTHAITNIVDPNAVSPCALAVNPTTNRIYVANCGVDPFTSPGVDLPGSVTIIDGVTNSLTALADPNAVNPGAIAVNPDTNRIYVANEQSNNVTVIDGSSLSAFTLAVVESGSGTGTIVSNPAGIDCPSSCSAVFESGTTITLDSASSANSAFEGWSGACSGTGASCMVELDSDQSVQAAFTEEAAADFSVNAASVSLTLMQGGHGSDTLTLIPEHGSFSNLIQLSCSVVGPSPAATCGLSPASVTLGANSATSTLTVSVPKQVARVIWHTNNLRYAILLPMEALPLLVFYLALKTKKGQRQLKCLSALFILFVALQIGCGGGSSSTTPTQLNYTITVTAAAGTIQHTIVVTVAVP